MKFDKGELVEGSEIICGSMIIYSSPVVNVNIFYTIYKTKRMKHNKYCETHVIHMCGWNGSGRSKVY